MSTRKERREIYNTPRWQRLRLDALDRDGHLCVRCAAAGLTYPAEIVHHKRPVREGGEPWNLDNLESLCRSCHEVEHRHNPPPHKVGPWAASLQELIQEIENEENEIAA